MIKCNLGGGETVRISERSKSEEQNISFTEFGLGVAQKRMGQ